MTEAFLTVAALLKSVPVTGDYWMIMQACVNSVTRIAEELKNEINDKCES